MGQPIFVVDARPNRETATFSRFALPFIFNLFSRSGVDAYGTSSVTAQGYLAPAYPDDVLTVMASVQTLAGLTGTTTSGTTTPVLINQYYFSPRHTGMIVPAQVIVSQIQVGIANSSGGAQTTTLASVQLELVKIAADGTVTQLATATDASTNSTTSGTHVAVARNINLTIASALTIADGELLALRINASGSSTGGATASVCINADGGGWGAGTNTSVKSTAIMRLN